jgi:hypothetical protein
MIGFYVVTRMVELLTTSSRFAVKTFAIVTLLVSIICVADLFMTGMPKT